MPTFLQYIQNIKEFDPVYGEYTSGQKHSS